MNPRYAFLLMFSFAAAALSAQDEDEPRSNRVIATDYNECQMGIKDTLGNWVVKPQYVMIYKMSSGDFEITDFNKSGVIDPDGRVIVPMIYDYVRSTYYESNLYYTVEKRHRYGVIDRYGKMIVPCKYKEIRGNDDSTVSARVSWRKWYIIHRDGTRFLVPYRSTWAPDDIDSSLFRSERGRWFLNDKYGIYNDSGEVLLKRKYFDIDLEYDKTISISSRKKRGYFTTDLDTIWPFIFDRHSYGYSFNGWRFYWYRSYVAADGVIAERINGRWGLVNMRGDTILPFKYDFAERIGYSGNNSVWEVMSDTLSGIYEAGKGWIVPISVSDMSTVTSYSRDSDSSYVGLFTGRKNGKYGLQSTTGDVIIPFEFTSIHNPGHVMTFINMDSVVVFTTSTMQTRHRLMVGSDTIDPYEGRYEWGYYPNQHNLPHEMIPDSGHFSVNAKEPGWKLYYHPGHLYDTLKHSRTGQVVPLDHNRKSDFPNEQLNASVFEVRTLKPQKVLPGTGGIYYEYLEVNHQIDGPEMLRFLVIEKGFEEYKYLSRDDVSKSVQDKSHTYYWSDEGLLFREDNKILSDREYYECSIKQTLPDSTVYFELGQWWRGTTTLINSEGNYLLAPRKGIQVGQFNENYTWINTRAFKGKDRWELIDNRTNKTVYDLGKSWRSYGDLTGHFITDYSSKSGWFLYDVVQQKIVTKGYDEIRPADTKGELFFVRTCTGKHGMMNQAGNIVVDTLWNYFTPYSCKGGTAAYSQWSDDYTIDGSYRYFVFYNERTYTIYDVDAKTERKDKRFLVDSTLVTIDSITHKLTDIYDLDETVLPGTVVVYIDSTNRAGLKEWHYTSIFDSVFTRKRLAYYNPDYEWSFSSFNSCQYCGKKTKRYTYPAPNDYTEYNFYEVHFVSDSAVSLSGFTEYGYRRWYSNHLLTDAGVQPVTLQWLFDPRTDWRNYLINSVITYVNTHLNVQGDCHNPAGLPMLLNETFLIGKDGIELYPEGFYENGEQMMILLPWKECSPYLLPSMKKALPVPEGM